MSLYTLTSQVKWCLERHPNSRNSDKTLTILLWHEFYRKLVKKSTLDNQLYIKLNDVYALPSQDAIKRVRARFQNDKKKYLPTRLDVARKRGYNEEEWRSLLGFNPELRVIKDLDEV